MDVMDRDTDTDIDRDIQLEMDLVRDMDMNKDKNMAKDKDKDMAMDRDIDMNKKAIEGYMCDGTNELVTRMTTSEWRNKVASWRVLNEKIHENTAC